MKLQALAYNEGKKEMSDSFFTEADLDRKRNAFHNFYRDQATGGVRVFNGFNEELTLAEVEEIIRGLTASYLNISNEEYTDRTLDQIKYDVDYAFSECSQGPPVKKLFRKDLKRHYSIKCVNCLKEISTKTDEGYWIA